DDDRVRGPDARARERPAPAHPRPRRRRRDGTTHGGVSLVNWGQAIADAIALGALYGLVAVGIGLVFGVMRLINFAYGELITAGGYTLAFLNGEPAVVGIVACFAVVIALALLQERIVFRPLRGATPATMLVASFAISLLHPNI